MAASDDQRTLGRARLAFSSQADVDAFAEALGRFERGELSSSEWRAIRLVNGAYGQRQEGVLMLRAKIPQGVLTPDGLRALAEVSERFSRGFGHITTRQNFQFHFVPAAQMEEAMRLLAAAGITTREACGNAVRNVTCCPYAGVAQDERFDVTPYAEAITRHLLRHPLSSSLPRKFKIAAEGCPEDHAFTAVNDLGLRARVRTVEGRATRGFQVWVGGGTATRCTSGRVLHEFSVAEELLEVAEGVVRVFHRLGDRTRPHRNRLKYLIAQLGWDGFVAAYHQERELIRVAGAPTLPFDAQGPSPEQPSEATRPHAPTVHSIAAAVDAGVLKGPGILPERRATLSQGAADLERWRKTNVRRQKQPGFCVVTATVPLGDLSGAQLRVLAELCLAYADGQLRVTPEQNLLFRWVRTEEVKALHARLEAAGLGAPGASGTADVTSCPGADSCKLAVTHSRGLAKELGEFLQTRPDLVALAPDVTLKVSGCPNGCGLHHVAGIGFQGSMRKLSGRLVPQYFILVGGGLDAQGARFGELVAKVPARRVRVALERLLWLFASERQSLERASEFFARVDRVRVRALLHDLEALSEQNALPEDFTDLGMSSPFEHTVMEGECAS